MWLLEYVNYHNADNNEVSLWSSEEDAYKYACKSILIEIKNCLDNGYNLDSHEVFWQVNDLLAEEDFEEAIDLYNDHEESEFYSIRQISAGSFAGTIQYLNKSDYEKNSINITEAPDVSAGPINDHTCLSCGNKACSKTEKSCWRCGDLI